MANVARPGADRSALLEDVYLVDDLLEPGKSGPTHPSRSSIPTAYYMPRTPTREISEELHGDQEVAEWAYRRANHFARLAGSD